MSARFVRHLPCPQCGSKDNLGEWDDGHLYCFGCHYYVAGSASNRFEKHRADPAQTMVKETSYFDPPGDMSGTIGELGLQWLNQYELTVSDCAKYGIYWSEGKQQLIFLIMTGGPTGTMAGWQARNFRPGKPKYFTKIKDHYRENVVVSFVQDPIGYLVIVEDLISAIKLYNAGLSSICLLGCILHKEHRDEVLRLSHPEMTCISWLDSNKYDESVKISRQLNVMGIKCLPFYTNLDPKEYTYEEISSIIDCDWRDVWMSSGLR